MASIQEEGEEHDHQGTRITSPLLQPPALCGSPEEGDECDNSPVEQVALTVPVGDDPETPVLTFRMWVLGTVSCVALSFLNAFFGYRREPLTISAVSAQVAVVPVGRLMATALPATVFFRGRPWEFTLNPGPFNMEHVLITIFANAGAGSVFARNVITGIRVYYGKEITFFVSLLLVLTSQVLGFGWAGIFRRYLVEPAAMWWPSNLVQVSLFSYGLGFASLTATISHVLLFHGSEIWQLSKSAFHEKKMDVHTKLMRRYKQVPEWWFIFILVASVAITMFICEYYIEQLQLPWWGVLLACALSIFCTLPIGIIKATTNQTPALNIISEYIMGYLYPGRPIANMCFKVYGYIGPQQALEFLQDLKLGHYMKIPPRTMFMAQVSGTLIAATVYLGTTWWLLSAIPNICNTVLLPPDSPWTCPLDRIFYDASVIWGLISPRRIFGDLGIYTAVNWFFLGGAIAPLLVWFAHKAFPAHKWILFVNVPLLIGSTSFMPPATAVNYNTWILVAFLSGYVVYKYRRDWWERHNYLLSGALDAGLAFMAVLIYLCLGLEVNSLNWWGNDLDGCPLASCPTAKGISVDGCPVNI